MFSILASQEASCLCLEGDNDNGQFQVSLFLQLCQNSCPEEHLTLTNAEQVRIQIQVFYLEKKKLIKKGQTINIMVESPADYNNVYYSLKNLIKSDILLQISIQLYPAHHQTTRLFPIHEAFRNSTGSQDLISTNKNSHFDILP